MLYPTAPSAIPSKTNRGYCAFKGSCAHASSPSCSARTNKGYIARDQIVASFIRTIDLCAREEMIASTRCRSFSVRLTSVVSQRAGVTPFSRIVTMELRKPGVSLEKLNDCSFQNFISSIAGLLFAARLADALVRDCVAGHDGQGRINPQAAQKFCRRPVRVGEESGEKVVRLYMLTPLRARAPQRPVEQIASRFGDGHLAPHVNGAFGKFLFEQACDRVRVYADCLHSLDEEGAFKFDQRR